MDMNKDIVFISYARENRDEAERLYMNLREQEINVWLDTKCLKPGANWKYEIITAIRNAKYYILLISHYSMNKRGYVQNEIREALNVLSEFPRNQIFIIPVRLDDSNPIDLELLDLNWVDLYPDYYGGLAKILNALVDVTPLPLMTGHSDKMNILKTKGKTVDKGKIKDMDITLLVGERTAIKYTPFRTKVEFFQQFIDRLPRKTMFADTSLSIYITISTKHPNLVIGDDLLKRYPDKITIVLQHGYTELETRKNGFSVLLSFNSEPRRVGVPYEAILEIDIPEIGLTINSTKIRKTK